MKGLRLVFAAIVAGSVCAGAAVWFLARTPPCQRQEAVSAESPMRSPLDGLRRSMARWLLREGRRHLRNGNFSAASEIAATADFFAGEVNAQPLRSALEAGRSVMKSEFQALLRDAAEAGDRPGRLRFESRLEETGEMEATRAAHPR